MIKIASLIPSLHFGGDENRLLTLGTHIDRRRFDLRILLLRPFDDEMDRQRGSLRTAFAARDIPVREVRTFGDTKLSGHNGSALRKCSLICQVADILRREQIDIVDARMNYAIGIGVAAAHLARTPLTVGTTYRLNTLHGPVKYPLGQLSILALDALVSDSQATIDAYQHWLWRRHPEAHVIQNGIALPATTRSREAMLSFFDIDPAPTPFIIGQISRIMPFKGQEILLRAAAEILIQRPDHYLLLCGHSSDQEYPIQLMALAEKLGIASQVRIGGYPGPIGDVWNIVDLHAHPSLIDSSPIAIHESMALGRPALVSDLPGISELTDNGRSALMVETGSVESCRLGLVRLLDDAALRRQLGQAAQRAYLARHTPDYMTLQTEQLFERLLRQKHSE